MSDVYIIGTLSREDVIEKAALYYLRRGFSVSMVRKQSDEYKKKMIMQCFSNIENSDWIVAVPHQDGTLGEGTQYEVAYADYLRKRVDIWKEEDEKNE